MSYKLRKIFIVVLPVLALFWMFYIVDSVHTDWVRGKISRNVHQQLRDKADGLATAINNRISLLYGVKSFVEADPSQERLQREFARIASSISSNTECIRAVQLVRYGRITYLWPLERNRPALGRDLLNDPRMSVRRSVAHALRTDSVVLNGPIELIQGGSGIVARLRLNDTDGSVWGLAALVIDLPALLYEARIKVSDYHLRYALRSDDGDVFFGDAGITVEAPEEQAITLIGDTWTFFAVPVRGWSAIISEQTRIFRIAGSIIAVLLIVLYLFALRNRNILKRLVDHRTSELQHANEALRLQVAERIKISEDLTTALSRAEQSDRLKDTFIASMSHEIRTPLHVILGYIDLLGGMGEQAVYDHSTYVSNIRNAGNRLMRTVEQLLQLSRLKTGTLATSFEVLAVDATLEPIVQGFAPIAAERGLHVEYIPLRETMLLSTDRFCLEQSVTNLIDNAVKYTNKGYVRVETSVDAEFFHIAVRDTGIGIGKEYREQLFQPFTQEVSGYSRPYDGLGLGLTLTKRYVELNHGHIDVESEKGKGTVVTLSYPRSLAATPST